MPYLIRLADQGVHAALGADPGFMRGLNAAAGRLTYEPVARTRAWSTRPPGRAGLVAQAA